MLWRYVLPPRRIGTRSSHAVEKQARAGTDRPAICLNNDFAWKTADVMFDTLYSMMSIEYDDPVVALCLTRYSTGVMLLPSSTNKPYVYIPTSSGVNNRRQGLS